MYIKSKGHCVACGALPKDAATFKVGEKERTKVSFSIKVDEVKAEGQGKGQAVWLNCSLWGKLARAYAGLEKGDVVLVAGKLREFSYFNQKRQENVDGVELECEFVQVLDYPGLMEDEG